MHSAVLTAGQSLDPGISLTDLQRTFTGFQKLVAVSHVMSAGTRYAHVANVMLQRIIAQEPKNCAYTELFAGLSPDVTEKNSGGWSKCWLDHEADCLSD